MPPLAVTSNPSYISATAPGSGTAGLSTTPVDELAAAWRAASALSTTEIAARIDAKADADLAASYVAEKTNWTRIIRWALAAVLFALIASNLPNFAEMAEVQTAGTFLETAGHQFKSSIDAIYDVWETIQDIKNLDNTLDRMSR